MYCATCTLATETAAACINSALNRTDMTIKIQKAKTCARVHLNEAVVLTHVQ